MKNPLRIQVFLTRADRLEKLDIKVESVCADSSYDTALIHKEIENRKLTIYTPKKESAINSKTEYKRDDFTYSQERDEFTCPSGSTLKLRCLQRSKAAVFREYRSTAKKCKNCPNREKCLAPSQKSRAVRVNIFQQIVENHHSADGSDEYNEALRKRQTWCEGSFAAQKAYHNLRCLFRRGIKAAEDHCLLSATALNLKRLIKCLG